MRKKITGGLYMVLDPQMDHDLLLNRLKQALDGGVEIVQIWNNWPPGILQKDKKDFVRKVLREAGSGEVLQETNAGYVAVLINEEWELLKGTELDGVHFDTIPDNFQEIREEIGREFITGITCGSDLDIVRRADRAGFDYISFCAMFPSSSVDNCEIVHPETVREAGKITQLPIFVSGGITVDNLQKLDHLGIDGVAVISGILNSQTPGRSARDYKKALQRLQ